MEALGNRGNSFAIALFLDANSPSNLAAHEHVLFVDLTSERRTCHFEAGPAAQLIFLITNHVLLDLGDGTLDMSFCEFLKA